MINKNMKSQKTMRSYLSGLVLSAGLIASGGASAELLDAFANGGFEGYDGDTNSFNNAVPPGWTTTAGTPDVFAGDTNVYGMTWQSSSTGGDFLHGIGWDGNGYTESALQVGLDGLVIGQQYEISFEQSISYNQLSGNTETGFWEIVFGDETISSMIMSAPGRGIAGSWMWQTLLFTATSEIQTLEVVARSATGGRVDLGIDSFFLGDPGTNPDNPDTPVIGVSSPGTVALFGISLAFFGMRLRKSSQS